MSAQHPQDPAVLSLLSTTILLTPLSALCTPDGVAVPPYPIHTTTSSRDSSDVRLLQVWSCLSVFPTARMCRHKARCDCSHYAPTPCVTLYPGSALYAVRMWKGYRNAKCALLQVAGRTVLLIYATRRGLLEVYTHAHPLYTSCIPPATST